MFYYNWDCQYQGGQYSSFLWVKRVRTIRPDPMQLNHLMNKKWVNMWPKRCRNICMYHLPKSLIGNRVHNWSEGTRWYSNRRWDIRHDSCMVIMFKPRPQLKTHETVQVRVDQVLWRLWLISLTEKSKFDYQEILPQNFLDKMSYVVVVVERILVLQNMAWAVMPGLNAVTPKQHSTLCINS